MEKFFKILKPITIILLFIWIGVALIGCKAPKVIEKEKIIKGIKFCLIVNKNSNKFIYSVIYGKLISWM